MYVPAPTQCRRACVAGGGSLGAAAVAVAGGGGAAAAASFAHKGCYAPSDARQCNVLLCLGEALQCAVVT